jgi:hypothetical protein
MNEEEKKPYTVLGRFLDELCHHTSVNNDGLQEEQHEDGKGKGEGNKQKMISEKKSYKKKAAETNKQKEENREKPLPRIQMRCFSNVRRFTPGYVLPNMLDGM